MSDNTNEYKQMYDKLTLAQALDEFIVMCRSEGLVAGSIRYYKQELDRFVSQMEAAGVKTVEEVTTFNVRRFLAGMAETRNEGGVHASYRAVRALFNWYEREIEPPTWRNPMGKVRIKTPKIKAIPGVSLDDIKKLKQACGTGPLALRNRVIIMFLFDSLVRANELCQMNVRDVNLNTGAVRVLVAKGDQPRPVRIGVKTRKALRKYLQSREGLSGSSPLFVTNDGDRIGYQTLVDIMRTLAARAKMKRPALHGFRRAGALQLKRNGMDIMLISQILGHTSVEITKRYLAMDDSDFAEEHRAASPVDHMDDM